MPHITVNGNIFYHHLLLTTLDNSNAFTNWLFLTVSHYNQSRAKYCQLHGPCWSSRTQEPFCPQIYDTSEYELQIFMNILCFYY